MTDSDEPRQLEVVPGFTLYEIDNTVGSCMYGELMAHGPDSDRVRSLGREAFLRWKSEVTFDVFETAADKKMREDLDRLGEEKFAAHWDVLRRLGEKIGFVGLFRTLDAIYRRRQMQ